MDLPRHLTVLWKHRWIALGGILLGAVLAFAAAYDVQKLPNLERRGSEERSAESRIMVTQVGFPEGRVTLPFDALEGSAVQIEPEQRKERDALKFAPPERFSQLALLYSSIAIGDEVRARLPGPPVPGQIQAEALDATGNHTQFLPIIQLTTNSSSEAAALTLNGQTYDALKKEIEAQQSTNKIAGSERIRLNLLNSPQAVRISGPSLTASILALMLCLLATLALVHVLEALSLRRKAAALQEARETALTAAVPVELPPVASSGRRTG